MQVGAGVLLVLLILAAIVYIVYLARYKAADATE